MKLEELTQDELEFKLRELHDHLSANHPLRTCIAECLCQMMISKDKEHAHEVVLDIIKENENGRIIREHLE